MKIEFRDLYADEIDIRVGQVLKTDKFEGATLLLYKNARVDMDLLDEVVGANNWQREHFRDNANCIVSIYDETKKEWVRKEDTGTDSNTEAEKGRCSDSFKRACVNWGIGRSLYSSPKILIKCELNKDGKRPANGIGWYVKEIGYTPNHKINRLVIMETKFDKDTQIVFDWSLEKGQAYIDRKNGTTSHDSSNTNTLSTDTKKAVTGQDKRTKTQIVTDMIKDTELSLEIVEMWVMKRFKKTDIDYCTAEEFETIKGGILSVINKDKQ